MRKDTLKLLLVFLFGTIGAAIPVTGFYLLWSWCIAQVPVTLAWAGLAKVGITLVMVLIGGGATIGLTILGGILAGVVAAAVLNLD
jgi:hypothetical protein